MGQVNRGHTVGWLAIALALIATALVQRPIPINHDVAWTLTVADMAAGGAHIYRDVIELNPPLVFWIAGGVRSVSVAMGADPEMIYRLGTLVLLALSAFAVARLSGSYLPAVGVVVMFGLLSRYNFGQRDVLAAILLSPYVASAARQERESVALAIVLGVAVGLAVSLKPFYAGVWLLLALVRRRPIADLAAMATGGIYLAAVALLAPAYGDVVREFGALYGAWIDLPWFWRLMDARVLLSCSAALLVLLLTRQGKTPRWAMAMGVAALGAVLSFALQGKGFPYHAIPALGFAAIASAGALGRSRVVMWPMAGAGMFLLWYTAGQRPADQQALPVIRSELSHEEGRVLLLSHHLQRGVLAFRRTGRSWLAPVPSMWWVTVPPDAGVEPAKARLMAEVATSARDADVVLVEAAPHDFTPWGPGLDRLVGPELRAVLDAEFGPVDSTGYLYRWQRKPPG